MRRSRYIAIICLSLSTHIGFSQANQPLAEVAEGWENPRQINTSFALAGISSVERPDANIQLSNPAALANLKYTVFEMGGLFSSETIKDGGFKYANGTGSLAYLGLGMSFDTGIVSSITLSPYSRTNYDLRMIDVSSGDTVNQYLNGSGGINNLAWGLGLGNKWLNFGVSASYLFGEIDRVSQLNIQDTGIFTPTDIRSTQTDGVGGVLFDVGIQSSFRINRTDSATQKKIYSGYSVSIGANGRWSQKLSIDRNELVERILVTPTGTADKILDSFQYAPLTGDWISPGKISAGIGLEHFGGKEGHDWFMAAEYTFEASSQAVWLDRSNYYSDRTRIAIAGWIKTKYETKEKNLIKDGPKLSLGFYAGQEKYKYNGAPLSKSGMTFGVGFPKTKRMVIEDKLVPTLFYPLNLAVEVGSLSSGTYDYSQFIFNVMLSYSMHEKWFRKRKIN